MRAMLLLALPALALGACGPNADAPPSKAATPPAKAPSNSDLPVTGAPAPRIGQPPLVGVMHGECERGGPAERFPVLIEIGQGEVTMSLVRGEEASALPHAFPMDASGHMQGSDGPNREDQRWEGDLRAAPPPQHAVGRGIITFGIDFAPTGQRQEANIPMCTLRWTLGPGMSAGNRPPPTAPAAK